MAESIKTLVRDVRATVPANTTQVVDFLPLVAFRALEYTIVYQGDAPLKVRVLKLLVRKTDTELTTQVYGKNGDTLNIGIDAFINGANAEVRLNNLENFVVNLTATRMLI